MMHIWWQRRGLYSREESSSCSAKKTNKKCLEFIWSKNHLQHVVKGRIMQSAVGGSPR